MNQSLDISGWGFLMVTPAAAATTGTDAPPEIILVQNWFDGLQRLVPTTP